MKLPPRFSVLVMLLAFLLSSQAGFTQSANSGAANPDSVYVTRMMSLDRNADGFLDATELPGKLSDLLTKHDSNSDGQLDAGELSAVETQAMQARMADAPSEAPSRAGRSGPAGAFGGGPGQNRPGQNRPGANRPAGGRRIGNGVQGSPLDAAQILRFALTFDADKDGGLSSEELKLYATALAARRALAQQSRSTEGVSNGHMAPAAPPERPKGLTAPDADATDDPFGD